MQLVELSESDKDRYNHFIATNPSGSFLQSWEWGQWQQELGREVKRFFIGNGEKEVGSAQFIKMPVWRKRFYWYAPYGPVGDFGFEILDFRSELQKKFSDVIFYRIEPKPTTYNLQTINFLKSQNIQPGKTLIIDLAKSEDQLLADMHHKTRYNIKVAQKHGVEIKDEFD